MDSTIGSDHFLALPRPDIIVGPPAGIPDTTTLAAHDFDVDTRTGFMPPQPPLARLPAQWESWEAILDDAIQQKLKLGDTPQITEAELNKSELWRSRVRDVRRLLSFDVGSIINLIPSSSSSLSSQPPN
jgi:indoleamine 2,3-dioxygenase